MKLLVSVRSAGEARTALAGGAQILDIKEPARGSLGRATPQTWREVVAAMRDGPNPAPVSVALGELLEADTWPDSDAFHGIAYAKVGLAGCRCHEHWQSIWQQALTRLPPTVTPVAVAYVDPASLAPPIADVLAAGAALGCRLLLLDTFQKGRGGLFDFMSAGELAQLAASARQLGLGLALAGSLDSTTLPRALALEPDVIAVRGAACREARTSEICATKVRELHDLLQKWNLHETCR